MHKHVHKLIEIVNPSANLRQTLGIDQAKHSDENCPAYSQQQKKVLLRLR